MKKKNLSLGAIIKLGIEGAIAGIGLGLLNTTGRKYLSGILNAGVVNMLIDGITSATFVGFGRKGASYIPHYGGIVKTLVSAGGLIYMANSLQMNLPTVLAGLGGTQSPLSSGLYPTEPPWGQR